MKKETISINNIVNTRRKARHGPSFRSAITSIRLRTSTGPGMTTSMASGTFRGISGLATNTSTGECCICLHKNFSLKRLLLDRLTSRDQNMVLRIVLEDFKDNHVWVEYGSFKICSEKLNYSLVADEYRGSIADSFLYHNNQPFSTFDRNNEQGNSTCAQSMGSGWWFKK